MDIKLIQESGQDKKELKIFQKAVVNHPAGTYQELKLYKFHEETSPEEILSTVLDNVMGKGAEDPSLVVFYIGEAIFDQCLAFISQYEHPENHSKLDTDTIIAGELINTGVLTFEI